MVKKYLSILLVVMLGITSCRKNEEPRDPDPVVHPRFGDVSGSIWLYDEGLISLPRSGMIVTVEGTTPVISAVSDALGNFTLADVPYGTHTVAYEKSGFGTFKNTDLEHSELYTYIPNTPSLGQISTTQITNHSTNLTTNNAIISITTIPTGSVGNRLWVNCFLSTNPNVDYDNYTYFARGATESNPFDVTIPLNDLINAGFSSGNTVYVKTYGDSYYNNQYFDPILGRFIFPNLNITTIGAVSFIVP